MSEFEFRISENADVARIDLGRPDEGNALTRDMMVTLAIEIRRLATRPVKAVVIEARGSQFCKGRDGRGENSAGLMPHEARDQLMAPVLGVYEAISSAQVPVVALVKGDAIGFGAALSVACDVTLASDDARFSFPEIKHNIAPTMAMAAVLKKIPAKALTYLIYSAESVEGSEAVMLGLASRCWPAAEFDHRANAFLTDLVAKPRLILETIKKYQRHASELSPELASEYAGTLLALVRGAAAKGR